MSDIKKFIRRDPNIEYLVIGKFNNQYLTVIKYTDFNSVIGDRYSWPMDKDELSLEEYDYLYKLRDNYKIDEIRGWYIFSTDEGFDHILELSEDDKRFLNQHFVIYDTPKIETLFSVDDL